MGSGAEVARFTVARLGGDRPLLPGTNPEQTDLDPQALLLPCSSCGILLPLPSFAAVKRSSHIILQEGNS